MGGGGGDVSSWGDWGDGLWMAEWIGEVGAGGGIFESGESDGEGKRSGGGGEGRGVADIWDGKARGGGVGSSGG